MVMLVVGTGATTWSVLGQRAAAQPDTAVIIARYGTDDHVTTDHLRLHAQVRSLALALADRYGVGRGDRVLWALGNADGGHALTLYHAVALLGAVNVPVNIRSTAAEIRTLCRASEPTLCVAAPHLVDRVREATAATVLPTRDAAECLHDLLANADAAVTPACAPDDPVVLLYTSGTTGQPKGVVHTHATALAAAEGWADCFALTPRDRYQSPFPVFSGAGLHFSGLACLLAGACYIVDDFDAPGTAERLQTFGTTVFAAVPAVYRLLVDRAGERFTTATLPALRLFDYGGAPMPATLVAELAARFPDVALVQTYGLTEAGPGGTYLPAEYARSHIGALGLRPAGAATEVRVADDEGRDVPVDTPGELLLRGPAVMTCYYRDPAATAAAFHGDWLRSGDIVRRDADGFLHYVDRRRDLIIRGGFNISSIEVEEVLRRHADVTDAAVVATPNPVLGEDIAAFVTTTADAAVTQAQLLDHCANLLADYKVPQAVHVVAELPRNAGGKVRKPVLRQWAAAALEHPSEGTP